MILQGKGIAISSDTACSLFHRNSHFPPRPIRRQKPQKMTSHQDHDLLSRAHHFGGGTGNEELGVGGTGKVPSSASDYIRNNPNDLNFNQLSTVEQLGELQDLHNHLEGLYYRNLKHLQRTFQDYFDYYQYQRFVCLATGSGYELDDVNGT